MDLNQFKVRHQFYLNLLFTAIAVAGLWLLRRSIYQLGTRKVEDTRALYTWRKSTTYLYYLSIVILLGFIWLCNLENLATYIGLVTAGFAIALSDPITNIAGWIYVLWRRLFLVDERIQIGEGAGDVIDLELFQFMLLEIGNWVDADQRTGRMIHIPNKMVFAEPLANYSKGFKYIWNEISALITIESDWRKCKQLLNQVISRYDQKFSHGMEDQLQNTAEEYLINNPSTAASVFT